MSEDIANSAAPVPAGLSGSLPYRWMEPNAAPTESGVYAVVYEIDGQYAQSTAAYEGRTWSHHSPLLAPLFRYWLNVGQAPAPVFGVTEAPAPVAGNGVPVSQPGSLEDLMALWENSDDHEEEWLNDSQVVVYLQNLSNANHEDWFSYIQGLDPAGEHTSLATPQDIVRAKAWFAKVVSDLRARGFVTVVSGLSVGLTALGMDVVINGLSDVEVACEG